MGRERMKDAHATPNLTPQDASMLACQIAADVLIGYPAYTIRVEWISKAQERWVIHDNEGCVETCCPMNAGT